MDILNALKQLRDDIKTWVTNNLNALNAKIDEKTIPIDSELSSTSTNPVQNKAIKKAIDNIPKFSGDYNDLTNAPNIAEDESGNMVIADEAGNVIFKADEDGIHTTAVSINGENAATETYVDDAISKIDMSEVNLDGYATEEFVTTAIDTAKEELSESIVADAHELKIVDDNGNIIFSVDADGAHTTELTLNGESVVDIVDDRVVSLVDSVLDTSGFAPASHSHTASDLTDTVPISNGGTDATTAREAEYNISGSTTESTAATSDTSLIVYRYTTPTTEKGAFCYKKATSLKTYILNGATAKTGTDYTTARMRNIYYNTASMTATSSSLSSGNIYLQYE